jgi:hypothetical protein
MSAMYGALEGAEANLHEHGHVYDDGAHGHSADSHPLLSELDDAERGEGGRRRFAVPKGVALVLGSLACLAYASKARSDLSQSTSGSAALASKVGHAGRVVGAGKGYGDDATGLTGGQAFLEAYPLYFAAGHTGAPLTGESHIYMTYGDEVKLVSDQHGDSVDVVLHSKSCKTFFTTGTGVYSFDEFHGDNGTMLYGGSQPGGIDLCETTGDLYWADQGRDTVYRGCSEGDVDLRCNQTALVTGLPGVRDVNYMEDEDGNCRKLYMAVPHIGVFHADCNGTALENLVPNSNPKSVALHRRSYRVYWVDKGTVMSADMVSAMRVRGELQPLNFAAAAAGTVPTRPPQPRPTSFQIPIHSPFRSPPSLPLSPPGDRPQRLGRVR